MSLLVRIGSVFMFVDWFEEGLLSYPPVGIDIGGLAIAALGTAGGSTISCKVTVVAFGRKYVYFTSRK